jgi:hypothetical protein
MLHRKNAEIPSKPFPTTMRLSVDKARHGRTFPPWIGLFFPQQNTTTVLVPRNYCR